MPKTRQKHEKEPGALKLSGAGLQPEQHGSYNLTLRFGEATFVKAALRPDAGPSEVAARLRKLADEVEALDES
jgi:hypothetical protein